MHSKAESAARCSSLVDAAVKQPRIPRSANPQRGALPATRQPQHKRISSLWRRKSSPIAPPIGQMPNEILIMIFGSLERDVIDPSVSGKRKRDDLRFLPLVCKAWYGPATNVLYEIVDISRVSSVFKFHRSLAQRPHLRRLVKTLALPGRVWRSCPPRLMRVFLQIIDYVESLETLYSMCQLVALPGLAGDIAAAHRAVLPLSSIKHKELRYIDLYANTWDRCIFPSILAFSFEKLEWLALYGFCLQVDVCALKTPPLPNLTTVSCLYGDAIRYLDTWLQTCPKLATVLLRDTYLKRSTDGTPPLGILTQGTVTHLKINQMFLNETGSETPFDWLSQCDTLTILELDWNALSRFKGSLPSSVNTLILRVEYEPPVFPRVVSFLDENPAVRTIEWRVCKHDKWFINNRPRLEAVMSECGVAMLLDYIPCFCRHTIARATTNIINPFAQWTLGHIRRIGNKEMAEIMEWERA